MYLLELRGEVSQGDIFDDLPTVYIQRAGLRPSVRNALAILLTHDCEYDKPRTDTVMIAEVRPLSDVDKGSRSYIIQNRVLSAFYLPVYEDIIPASYVDLRTMSRLEKTIVASAQAAGKRLLSLNDDSRLALQRQMALFLGVER